MEDSLKILERKVYREGSRIFREGEPGARAYIVQAGQVEILRKVDGEEQRLGVVGKGGIFGEMALIDDAPRMATASALTNATVVMIDRETFRQKMRKSDPLIVALLRIFANNIRSMSGPAETPAEPAPAAPAAAETPAEPAPAAPAAAETPAEPSEATGQ